MIDFAPLLKIAPLFLVTLASPGPDFMLVSSIAMSRGRASGILAAAGIALGISCYGAMSMWGLGLILAQMQGLLLVIKAMGGLYLIYLGVQMWRASFAPETVAAPAAISKKKNPFVMGFLTNITNPKALVFLTSIFALIMKPGVSAATQGSVIACMTLMTLLWFAFVATGLSASSIQTMYRRWSRWIDRVAGSFMGFFGMRLLFSKN